jgi:kynureninase
MTSRAFRSDVSFAEQLDDADSLRHFQAEFEIPRRGEVAQHYLCGHSLGLMAHAARASVQREIERWSRLGVDGHFDGDDGWFSYHKRFAGPLAGLLGAEAREVVAMNSLTVNLHLMLASFFRPDAGRRKILIEQSAFPSDRYAVQSQLGLQGLDRHADLIELAPARGALTAEALEAALQTGGDDIALVLLPGVQYLTGEALDLAACTAVAKRFGCRIGFDLAHAIGNLDLDLAAADADFAVWCSYKYLNGGPGAIGGCYVNRRHLGDRDLPRLAGWWGHDKRTRFESAPDFSPLDTAEAWQLSNPPVLAMAPLEASLELFGRAGIANLRRKSIALTGYLAALVEEFCGDTVELLTPADAARRGAQLSLRLHRDANQAAGIVDALRDQGVIVDWRSPNVLRLAPAPLYNSFVDVHASVTALAAALRA